MTGKRSPECRRASLSMPQPRQSTTPERHVTLQNQNSQSRRVSTTRAVGLAPATPSTRAKGGWNKKGASVEAPIGLNFPCGKGERIARTPTSASIPRHDDMSTPKAPKKEAPVGNGGVMTGNTALVPNLLAMAFRFRQRKVPSGTSIYHTRTPCQRKKRKTLQKWHSARYYDSARSLGMQWLVPTRA